MISALIVDTPGICTFHFAIRNRVINSLVAVGETPSVTRLRLLRLLKGSRQIHKSSWGMGNSQMALSTPTVRQDHPSRPSERVATWAVPIALLGALLIIFMNWSVNWWRTATAGFDGWGTGEWLLSYDGGFVRRGLSGTLILFATPTEWSLVRSVALVQIAAMGILFIFMFLLFLRTSRSKTWAMVILSPATLMYPTIVFANQQAGPRKEILVLAALAVVAYGITTKYPTAFGVVGLLIFTLGVWSHEASSLLLPAFIYIIWKGFNPKERLRSIRILIASYTVIAFSAGIASVLSPGNTEVQQGICSAWSERGIQTPCQEQALGALTLTAEASINWFRPQLFPRYWEYLPVVALAIVPLFAVRFLPRYWRPATVITLFQLPLFYIAWDYGRWIVLIATALSIVALAVATRPDPPEPMNVPTLAILAYILLWGFPGYSNEPPVMFDGWLTDWLKAHLPTAWF